MMERIWDPVDRVAPTSSRIIQDAQQIKVNAMLVVEADVAVVAGVCNHNGHRNSTGIRRTYHSRHEDQTVVSIDELNLHTDYREVMLEIHNTEKAKFKESIRKQSNSE